MATPQVLYDTLYPLIKGHLSKPANVAELRKIYNNIISRNNEALSATIPSKSVFMPADIDTKLFAALGLSRPLVMEAIKKSPHIPKQANKWMTCKNPIYMALMLTVIYFNNENKPELVKQTMFILSLYMYRNIRSKYFSRVSEATVKTMEYTISRLSYKNDLKKYGSVLKMIGKKNDMFINNWFEARKKETSGAVNDDILCRLINDNHRRFSTAMNSFYAEFKEDSLAGNYLNVDEDIDDGDKFIESDNASFIVEKAVQKVSNKLSLSAYPDSMIIDHSCGVVPGCSINNLRTIVSYMYDKGLKEFEDSLRMILQTYLFDYKHTVEEIKSFDFITDMTIFYKKQTEKNKNLTQLKRNIESFIVGSKLNKRITRDATLNDCRKATLVYILFFIQRNI